MKSWDEVQKDRLEFPIGGKTYVVPELSYQSMLVIERAKAGEKTILDDAPADETWRIVLGHVWDDMVTDNVPGEALMRAGLAALAFFQFGLETAEAIWETGVDPKALEAAMRAAQEGSTRSPSSAKASSTRKRASTSGTTSRRATPPAAKSPTTKTRKGSRS